MRKVILIGLAVFVAVLAGGYCILWYSQASQFKRAIEQNIENANRQQKYFTYDSIEISGFPSNVYVSIVRPHFSGRIDPFLKLFLSKMHPNQPELAALVPEWNEDTQLDGRIIIGVNALSDHYSLRNSGNWKRSITIGGQTLSIVGESTGDAGCELQMARTNGLFSDLWDYHALMRDNAKDFLKDFRSLDCGGPGNTISDATSHQKLIGTGPWQIYSASEPQDDEQKVRIYLKMSDVEITPQGDAMVQMQRNALAPESYPIKYSMFGKQNMEIDFSYKGPSDWQTAGKNPPLDIQLSKFDVSNQLSTSSITFALTNAMKGADRASRVAFKAQSSANEQYDAFIRDMVHSFIQQLYSDKRPPQSVWLQPYTQKYTADDLYGIVTPVIPNFHALGLMVQSVDASFQGDPELNAGDFALADLELSASLYGIKGNGTAKRVAGHLFPTGQGVLTCRNCAKLVDDVMDYAARFQKMMSYFQTPEQTAATTPIDAKLTEGIKDFLKALAQVKDNDYVYNIVSNEDSGITISGKSVADIMAMYNEYVASLLKANAAGNEAPVATPAPVAPVTALPDVAAPPTQVPVPMPVPAAPAPAPAR